MSNRLLQIKAHYPDYYQGNTLETFYSEGFQLLSLIRSKITMYYEDLSVKQKAAVDIYCNDSRDDDTYLIQKAQEIEQVCANDLVKSINGNLSVFERLNKGFVTTLHDIMLKSITALDLENVKFYQVLASVKSIEDNIMNLDNNTVSDLSALLTAGVVNDAFISKYFLQLDPNCAKKELLRAIEHISHIIGNANYTKQVTNVDDCYNILTWYRNNFFIITHLSDLCICELHGSVCGNGPMLDVYKSYLERKTDHGTTPDCYGISKDSTAIVS